MKQFWILPFLSSVVLLGSNQIKYNNRAIFIMKETFHSKYKLRKTTFLCDDNNRSINTLRDFQLKVQIRASKMLVKVIALSNNI